MYTVIISNQYSLSFIHSIYHLFMILRALYKVAETLKPHFCLPTSIKRSLLYFMQVATNEFLLRSNKDSNI